LRLCFVLMALVVSGVLADNSATPTPTLTEITSACGPVTPLVRSQLGFDETVTDDYPKSNIVMSKTATIATPGTWTQFDGVGMLHQDYNEVIAAMGERCPDAYFGKNYSLGTSTPFGTTGLVPDDCAVECTAQGDACHAFAFNNNTGTCALAASASSGGASVAGVGVCIKGSSFVDISFHSPATDGVNLLATDTPSDAAWNKGYCDGSSPNFNSETNVWYDTEPVGDGTMQEVVHWNGTCGYWYDYSGNLAQALAVGEVYQVSAWIKVFPNSTHPIKAPFQIRAYTGINSPNTGRMLGEYASVWPDEGWRLLKWVLPANVGTDVWNTISFSMPQVKGVALPIYQHFHVAFAAPRVERMISGPTVGIQASTYKVSYEASWQFGQTIWSSIDSVDAALDAQSVTVRLDFSEIGGPIVHSLDQMMYVDATGFTCKTGVSPQLLSSMTDAEWADAFASAPIQKEVCGQTWMGEQFATLRTEIHDVFNATFACTASVSSSAMSRWCRLRTSNF